MILFLVGTATIVIGGPLAYFAVDCLVPGDFGDQAWRGLAALSGSWIGGGANFLAIGESVDAEDTTISMMAVIDVAVANVWMAILLFFSTHQEKMDDAIGADRSGVEELKKKIESFQKEVQTVATLGHLFAILFIAMGATVLAHHVAPLPTTLLSHHCPWAADILGEFAWKVIIVTAIGVPDIVIMMQVLAHIDA